MHGATLKQAEKKVFANFFETRMILKRKCFHFVVPDNCFRSEFSIETQKCGPFSIKRGKNAAVVTENVLSKNKNYHSVC